PRIPSQSFTELPSEEEILEFLSDQQVPDWQKLWHRQFQIISSTNSMGILSQNQREATPKPKASGRKKKGDSASSTTPPTPTPTTTVVSAPRLSATAKVSESEGESDEEETRQEEEESFDPISKTPEGSEDESNDEEE
nr:hypothetical protein [Tanacetum cinerariifolium]